MQENFWRQYFVIVPRGLYGLILIQFIVMFCYSVIFATASDYLSQYLLLDYVSVNTFYMALFSWYFINHIFAGIIGGRLLNLRVGALVSLLLISLAGVLQLYHNINVYYWGVALLIIGISFAATNISSLITQLYKPEDIRRETAFMWNFTLMNVAFLSGYLLKDVISNLDAYKSLFVSMSILGLLGVFLLFYNWRSLHDRSTYLLTVNAYKHRLLQICGFTIILMLVGITHYFITNFDTRGYLLGAISIIATISILFIGLRQPSKQNRNKVFAFMLLISVSIVFWTIILIIPTQLAILLNQLREQLIFGSSIYSHYYQSTISIIIIISCPLISCLFFYIRCRGIKISLPIQFSIGLLLIGVGLLILPHSFNIVGTSIVLKTTWIFICFIFIGLSQVFIQPTGFAMVGQLSPITMQSYFMGCWLSILGSAMFFADFISKNIFDNSVSNMSIKGYFNHSFYLLAWTAIGVALGILLLLPLLNKLIRYRSLNPMFNKKMKV